MVFLVFGGGGGGTQGFALSFFTFGGGDGGTQGPELALESLASSGAKLGLFSAAGADLGAGVGLLCGAGGDLGAGVGLLSGARVGVFSGAGLGPLWAAGEFAGSEPRVGVSAKYIYYYTFDMHKSLISCDRIPYTSGMSSSTCISSIVLASPSPVSLRYWLPSSSF